MYAVYNGCEETARELVTAGANIEAVNEVCDEDYNLKESFQ